MRREQLLLQAKLAGQLEERGRIARELHDTLLQGTQGLILQIQGIAGQLRPLHPMREQIESALDEAEKLLDEARERVWNLRPSTSVSNIALVIERHGKFLAERTAIGFEIQIQGTARGVRPEVAAEIYAITREALTNAFAHSDASTVRAKIHFGARSLIAQVTDDGRGFEVARGETADGRHHFGIKGMRERARMLDAKIKIYSTQGYGTEIQCTIAASTAYSTLVSDRSRFSIVVAIALNCGRRLHRILMPVTKAESPARRCGDRAALA
jgi:signal transduction histidine kinase